MARRKNTTNLVAEQEYNKELKRIQQFLRRASKRGFIWDDSVIPKRPKKITEKSVAKLKRITPDVLYKKGQYLDTSTGELLSGVKGRALERKKATEKALETRKSKKPKDKKGTKKKKKPETKGKKHKQQTSVTDIQNEPTQEYPEGGHNYYPNFTDVVLSNFLATLKLYPNAEGVPLLLNWYDRLIGDNGREAVAQMLQDGAEAGIIITWETVYKSTNTKTYMTEMMAYLPDQGRFYSDQIMDMIEESEWWEQPE